ncbi:carboxypeptidase regulatory-like domain-containing protein [Porphyromonadaceae bacterium W3.11]|nr:carboxypeptidase regulatory-like domain-containing protein [Porphyromonadaceae bacterium W3.11]
MQKITKLLSAFSVLLMLVLPLQAQESRTSLEGRVVDAVSNQPVSGVLVTLQGSGLQVTTGGDGTFTFINVEPGKTLLYITSSIHQSKEYEVVIVKGRENRLDDIEVVQISTDDSSLYAGLVNEMELGMGDDEASLQEISTMMTFSSDVYLQKSGYQLSQFRHRTRGYDSKYEERYINGVNFNEGVRGVFNYSSIGALNDLTRNGNRINYLSNSNFSFGKLGGSEDINMRPSNYAKGGKATISGTNRNYYSRIILSYNTGLMDNGWAFTAGIGGRYSHEGAIAGVFYRNISYMLGAEKVWDKGRHSLSFITFGSPVQRGQQGASVEEALKLVGCNTYNPNWGYQNGKKRNARVVKSWDPTAILSHVWKINEETTLTTGLAAHYNRYGKSALNWYNGVDPRPDYYRYLPSYFSHTPILEEYYQTLWMGGINSQINWDRLYEVNHMNNIAGDGSAIYMVEERRSDLGEIAFNSTLNKRISRHVKLSAGLEYKYSFSKQFKTVDDLMGADYLLDVDKFSERDFPGNTEVVTNDLNKPGRRVWEGDVFGYDYRYRIHNAGLWVQNVHNYNNIDLYYGAKLGLNTIQREGKMRNGRFPDNSFGRSDWHTQVTMEGKAGVTYKFSGRHFLNANASYQQVPHNEREMFVAPDVTDQVVPSLKPLEVASADLNYVFTTPKIRGRLGLFYTKFWNDMRKNSYYNDQMRTFIHHNIYDVGRTHRGIELGVEYKPTDALTFDLIGTIGQYYYDKDAMGVMNSGNGMINNEIEKVYLKNLYLGGVPQMLGTFGIGYFYNYWFFNVNVNGFGMNHIDIAPVRRMASAYTNVIPEGVPGYDPDIWANYKELTTQERFKGGATVDLSIGKILYLKNRDRINFNFSVNNLLNKTDIRTGGYEQGRVRMDRPASLLGNKHFYMQGINFFFNASYNW